jgi:two-component system, NtrC family, response regulator HydG
MNQPVGKKTHILIVDDDWNTLRSMEYILMAANYNVTTLTSSPEALQRISATQKSSSPVDLLITDVQIPGLNGLELLAELRRQDIEIPTLVITADSNQNLQFELVRLGYDNILIKPFDEIELLTRITELLEAKHQRESLPLRR